MKKGIVGTVITLVIGGTGYTASQTDIVNNFAKNTGMSQQEAKQYVEDSQKDLVSFSKIGQDLTADGNGILAKTLSIDCANYTYTWETSSLSCAEGLSELQTIGNNEVTMGNCYSALGTDLGSSAKSKISECINDIDTLDSSYKLPIATSLLSSSQITDSIRADQYNKSLFQAALQSK